MVKSIYRLFKKRTKHERFKDQLEKCRPFFRKFITDIWIWLLDPSEDTNHAILDYCPSEDIDGSMKLNVKPFPKVVFSKFRHMDDPEDIFYYSSPRTGAIELTYIEEECFNVLFHEFTRIKQRGLVDAANTGMQEYVLKQYKSLLQD